MDENLQAKIDEARAQGYTDEQIEAYLNPKPVERLDQKKDGTGGPVNPWVDRSEEKTAMGQYGASKLAELGAEIGTGVWGGKKLINAAGKAFRGAPPAGGGPIPPGPVGEAPALETGGQRLVDFVNQGGRQRAGQMLGQVAAVPAALSMPYMGAAYEQSRIRENPNAPEYANNPYAQMTRGEAPTQGAAGAMNRRNAIAGQQYGGLSKAEQDMLQQDAIDRQIRLKAAQKVLGPVAPTGQ